MSPSPSLTAELTSILEKPEVVQRIAAVVRAAAAEPDVAALLRDFFPGQLLDALQGLLGPGDPGLRIDCSAHGSSEQ
jgi:hypothetical protein